MFFVTILVKLNKMDKYKEFAFIPPLKQVGVPTHYDNEKAYTKLNYLIIWAYLCVEGCRTR